MEQPPSPPYEHAPRPVWQQIIGWALIGTGALGLILSLGGLITVAAVGASAEAALLRELDTLDQALSATGEGLSVAEGTLGDARTTLTAVGAAVSSATEAITTTQPTLKTLEALAGEDLPATVNSTRQALDSAQATAQVVDGVLGALSFVGLSYNPDVPLNLAIAEVSDSLAGLPANLETMAQGLGEANTQITVVASDLSEVATGITTIAERTDEALSVIEQYQVIVGDLRGEVAAVREAAPGWIRAAQGGIALLLIWLALAQIGLFAQGWERVGRRAKRIE